MFRKAMLPLLLAATAATPAMAQPGAPEGGRIERETRDDRQRGPDGPGRGEGRRFDERPALARPDGGRRRDERAGERGFDRRFDDRGAGRDDRRWAGRDRRDDWRWNQPRNGWNDNRWNDEWRSDDRYDWQRYRQANRGFYRLPRYYGPGGDDGYRRYGAGFRLGSPFYDRRYWISDPYAYRLPPAYGGWRWIRYYDDVLLIDVTTGVVRDVIHGFFWR